MRARRVFCLLLAAFLLAALLPTALGMALCAAFTALARLLGW